jgi:malonate decarboxylase beta subunit
VTLAALEEEHRLLAARLAMAGGENEAQVLWRRLGIEAAAQVPDYGVDEVRALRRSLEQSA